MRFSHIDVAIFKPNNVRNNDWLISIYETDDLLFETMENTE